MHNAQGQRHKLEKSTVQKIIGGSVVAVVVVAVVTVSIVLGIRSTRMSTDYVDCPTEEDSFEFQSLRRRMDYCPSETCVHTASRMLHRMDSSVDPCEDFSRTACGKYSSHKGERMGASTQVKQLSIRKLHNIIARGTSQNNTKIEKAVKKIYKACMDTRNIKKLGLAPIKDTLLRLGGWPVLEGQAWNSSNFQWIRLIHHLRKLGLESNYILKCYVDASSNNSRKMMITFDQPDLSLSRQNYLKRLSDKTVQAYTKYQVDVAMKLGANREDAIQQMQDVLLFEISLANISTPIRQIKSARSLEKIMSLTTMIQMYHSIPWLKYINQIVEDNVKFINNENVNVKNTKFIQDLEILLANTTNETLANYIIWRAVDSLIHMGPSDIMNIHSKYLKIKAGFLTEPPRWEKCTRDLIRHLPTVTSAIFASHYFNVKILKEVARVVNGTLKGLRNNLGKADWLDDESRKQMSKDLQAVTFHIPYTESYSVLEAFDGLVINRSSYMAAMLSATRFKMQQMATCLREEVDTSACQPPSYFTQTAITYSPVDKALRIPLEDLQGVFFDYKQQNYVNFASLGSYVGYTIAREYFDEFESPDHYKQLTKWWAVKQNTLREFSCLNASNASMSVTHWENLVYLIGVNASYTGYTPYWASRRMNARALPGFNLMGKREMFWIAAAQVLCPVGTRGSVREDMERHLFSDIHAETVFSNVKQLLSDFKCTEGTHNSKCDVW